MVGSWSAPWPIEAPDTKAREIPAGAAPSDPNWGPRTVGSAPSTAAFVSPAFTQGSALVNHDDDAGTFTVGRRADLMLLDADVLAPGCVSEVLQRHLGRAHVVKVFNNITFWYLRLLARPAGAPDRGALPIAGDDPIARAALTVFLDAIGYDSVDAGMLGTGGRRFAFGSPAFVEPYGGLSDEQGTPVGVAALRAVLGV